MTALAPPAIRPRLIAIEGMDGAGKSTAVKHVVEALAALGHVDTVLTREPGGTTLGNMVREIVRGKAGDVAVSGKAEMMLMFAAREQHIAEVIDPALQAGKWVVTDRFSPSSAAYQAYGKNVSYRVFSGLDDILDCAPGLTIILDLAVEQAEERRAARGEAPDRIEANGRPFFERVRTGYLNWAKSSESPVAVVDASGSEEVVAEAVRQAVLQYEASIRA